MTTFIFFFYTATQKPDCVQDCGLLLWKAFKYEKDFRPLLIFAGFAQQNMIARIMCGGIIFTLMFVTFSSSAVYSIDLQRLYEMQKNKREGTQMSLFKLAMWVQPLIS